MTSNFALSLSSDGIRLLQRVQDGWHLVGETDLEVPDLAAELAKLREMALSLDPSGLRTKLLIPNEQIKYVTLQTAQTELSEVTAALEGATPYRIDELVIDFDRNGGRTYIAAVARETLAEAEAFAKMHNFAPVAFAAVPEPMTFKSEVFFGPTSNAKQVMNKPVVRDTDAIVVTGNVKLPEPEVEAEAEAPSDEPLFTPRTHMPDPESVIPTKAVEPSKSEETPPEVAKKSNTPKTDEPSEAAVLFTRRDETVPLAVLTGDAKGPAIARQIQGTPPPPAKSVTPTVREPTISSAIQRIEQNPAPAAVPTPAALTPAAPEPAPKADEMAAKGGFSSRRTVPTADEPSSDKSDKLAEEKAASIATKQAATKGRRPRFLGLILTAILLITMALIALWASTLSEEQLSGWFGNSTSSIVEIAAVEPQDPDPPVTQVAAVAPEALDATVTAAKPIAEQTATLPQLRADDTNRVLSPAEADRIYAATGVWQRAPRFPLEPRTESFVAPFSSTFDTITAMARPSLPNSSEILSDLGMLPPIDPPAAGTDFALDADGFVLATPEGTLTPQGAIVFAGAPDIRPPVRPTPTQEVVAAIEAISDVPEGVVLIAGPPPKIPPIRPANAALPEAAETVTAGGVDIAALRAIVRPEGIAPEQEDNVALAADSALSGNRPKTRPTDLAPTPAQEAPPAPDITSVVAAIAEAAPVSAFVAVTPRAVAASRRPDPRPRNFSRIVARATDIANQQAARAAAAAPAATAAAPTTAASNAAARPSGATSGGVAQAATLEGAIKLRNINLIGVYGRPNDRRALVRLGNGRYVKVQVGSALDGGQVTAIGDNALNYVKRGKTYGLQLPNG